VGKRFLTQYAENVATAKAASSRACGRYLTVINHPHPATRS
jgi:hypothetical protein